MNKIEISTFLPTKDFTKSELTTIIINQLDYDPIKQNIFYEYTIPSYMYDKIVDSEEKYQSYQSYKKKSIELKKLGRTTFENKTYFKKTIKEPLISIILEKISTITNDIIYLSNKEQLKKEKKIFIKFNNSESIDKDKWKFAYKGKIISSSFQFFIGYKVFNDNINSLKPSYTYQTYLKVKDGVICNMDEIMKTNNLLPLCMDNEIKKIESYYSIIDWSEEAETFLTNVQSQFSNLNSKLNDYLSNIDNEKMKWLIDTQEIKLLKN